jgi:hypothetical protein
MLIGTVIGALAAGMLAVPSLLPPAWADEPPMSTLLSTADELWPRPFDTSRLVKFDHIVEPSVSTEVLSSSTVRKIGYGRTEFVSIARTPTGTYSSDGLASPHVRYPGIHATSREGRSIGEIRLWVGGGWRVALPLEAGSFTAVTRFPGGRLLTTPRGQCAFVGDIVQC